ALLAETSAREARVKTAVAIGFLLLNLYVYHEFATRSVHPPRQTFDHFPLAEGDWVCSRPERMGAAVEQNLGVTDYHLCEWERPDARDDDAAEHLHRLPRRAGPRRGRRLGRDLDPPAGALPAGLGLGHHPARHGDRRPARAARAAGARAAAADREGQPAPARL